MSREDLLKNLFGMGLGLIGFVFFYMLFCYPITLAAP